jgi:hypothetical protein
VSPFIAVVLGVAFLHVFFRAVESQWPASYFAIASGPDYAISRSLGRYLTFRLLPLFVVTTFAAVNLRRDLSAVIVPSLAIGLTHGLVTSGRALLSLLRSGRAGSHRLVVAMHGAVIVLVTLTALIAAEAAGRLDAYVPPISTLTSDLWTGLVAGVIGAYAVRVSQAGHVNTLDVLAASRASIPWQLWRAVDDLARDHGADPALVRAVMLVENIQRPAWFRRLERVGSRLLGVPATIGVMQIEVPSDTSEEDALEQAVRMWFAGVSIRKDGKLDWKAIDKFGRDYNDDAEFVDLLGNAVIWVDDHAATG